MPNQGVPVIFKNKIAYGYAEKSVQAYDVSVSDYNALTEQQQLDGSIRFIQGVDAIPNGSNVWAKLGTTPLTEGLPRDCSQAVNQLKSNLTELEAVGLPYERNTMSYELYHCTSTSVGNGVYYNIVGDSLIICGNLKLALTTRTGANPGVTFTIPNNRTYSLGGATDAGFVVSPSYYDDGFRNGETTLIRFKLGTNHSTFELVASESKANCTVGKVINYVIPYTVIALDKIS